MKKLLNFIFFIYFKERILVHVPSRRPTIAEILSSQWVENQHITLESALAPSLKATSKGHTKKIHWFSRKRVVHRNIDSSQADAHLLHLHFNTNRANSILDPKFLHPIIILPAVVNDELNATPEKQPKTKRRSLLATSLKKKIGPMEDRNKTNSFESRMVNPVDERTLIANLEQNQILIRPTVSESINNITSNIDDGIDDEEQGDFIMTPTDTDDLSFVHPLEREARQILEKIGFTNEMLCRAIESGPRSDAMGAYRIVINRLQKQKLASKQEEMCTMSEPSIPHRSKEKEEKQRCSIL